MGGGGPGAAGTEPAGADLALLLPQKGDDLEEGVTSEGTAWPATWQLTPGPGAQGLHPTAWEPSVWSTFWCLA